MTSAEIKSCIETGLTDTEQDNTIDASVAKSFCSRVLYSSSNIDSKL